MPRKPAQPPPPKPSSSSASASASVTTASASESNKKKKVKNTPPTTSSANSDLPSTQPGSLGPSQLSVVPSQAIPIVQVTPKLLIVPKPKFESHTAPSSDSEDEENNNNNDDNDGDNDGDDDGDDGDGDDDNKAHSTAEPGHHSNHPPPIPQAAGPTPASGGGFRSGFQVQTNNASIRSLLKLARKTQLQIDDVLQTPALSTSLRASLEQVNHQSGLGTIEQVLTTHPEFAQTHAHIFRAAAKTKTIQGCDPIEVLSVLMRLGLGTLTDSAEDDEVLFEVPENLQSLVGGVGSVVLENPTSSGFYIACDLVFNENRSPVHVLPLSADESIMNAIAAQDAIFKNYWFKNTGASDHAAEGPKDKTEDWWTEAIDADIRAFKSGMQNSNQLRSNIDNTVKTHRHEVLFAVMYKTHGMAGVDNVFSKLDEAFRDDLAVRLRSVYGDRDSAWIDDMVSIIGPIAPLSVSLRPKAYQSNRFFGVHSVHGSVTIKLVDRLFGTQEVLRTLLCLDKDYYLGEGNVANPNLLPPYASRWRVSPDVLERYLIACVRKGAAGATVATSPLGSGILAFKLPEGQEDCFWSSPFGSQFEPSDSEEVIRGAIVLLLLEILAIVLRYNPAHDGQTLFMRRITHVRENARPNFSNSSLTQVLRYIFHNDSNLLAVVNAYVLCAAFPGDPSTASAPLPSPANIFGSFPFYISRTILPTYLQWTFLNNTTNGSIKLRAPPSKAIAATTTSNAQASEPSKKRRLHSLIPDF